MQFFPIRIASVFWAIAILFRVSRKFEVMVLLKSRIALGDLDFSSRRAFYPQPACMVGVLSFSAKAGNFAG